MKRQEAELLRAEVEDVYQYAVASAKKVLTEEIAAIDIVKSLSDVRDKEVEMKPIIKKGDALRRNLSLARASDRCEVCTCDFNLADHHVLPKSVYPQHRFNKNNSVILCVPCHEMIELNREVLLVHMRARPRFDDRLNFYRTNEGINKNPPTIDYEKQYEDLLNEV